MNPDQIQTIYSQIAAFLSSRKVSFSNLSYEFINQISPENLYSLFNEIFQREDLIWQDFFDFTASCTANKLLKSEDLKLITEFLILNNIKIEFNIADVKVNLNAIQNFDLWLFAKFNKFLADRIILYIKALYLYDHIEEYAEDFIRKPIIEIQGTLFELLKDNNELSADEKKFRRIIRDALYEVLPEVKSSSVDLMHSNTLTEEEKNNAYRNGNDFNQFYDKSNDIADLSSRIVENTVNGIPLEFPFNEYQVADEYIDPRLSLNLDRWMLAAGIIDSKSQVHPEMLFSNALSPASEKISNVMQIGVLRKIYKDVFQKNIEESLSSTPLGLNPNLKGVIAEEFANDLADRMLGFTKTGIDGKDITSIPLDIPSPNVFEVMLGALASVFASDKNTQKYVEYIVNKKVKEAKEDGGLIDEEGMFHKGLGTNQEFNKAAFQPYPSSYQQQSNPNIKGYSGSSSQFPQTSSKPYQSSSGRSNNFQSFPQAFKQGFNKSQNQFKNFNPTASKLSQFEPYGNFKKNGMGSFVTPNVSRMVDTSRGSSNRSNFTNSFDRAPIYSHPSLSNQIGKRVRPYLPPNETRNLQRAAFQRPREFKNALYQNPFSNKSPLSRKMGQYAPSVNKMPEFRRQAFANGLSKGAQNYNHAYSRGPFSPIANTLNRGVGRASQGLGGARFNPKYQPITNMASAIGKGAASTIPSGMREMMMQNAAMREARGQRSRMGGAMRGGQQAGEYVKRGAQYRNSSTSYIGIATIVGGVASKGTWMGAGAITTGLSNFSNFLNGYKSFNQLGNTVLTNGAYNKIALQEVFKDMLKANPMHPKAAYIQSLIDRISHKVPRINPKTGLPVKDKRTGKVIMDEVGTLVEDKAYASRFRNRSGGDSVIFISSSLGLLQSYTGLLFGSRGMIDSSFAFYRAAHETALGVTTFSRWALLGLFAHRQSAVGKSNYERFFSFFIGRHDDVIANLMNTDPFAKAFLQHYKNDIFDLGALASRTKWWEFLKRRDITKQIKAKNKLIDALVPKGFDLFGKVFKGFGFIQRGFGYISRPEIMLLRMVQGKLKNIAVTSLKRFGIQIFRKIFARAIIRFGITTFTIAASGIGGVLFAAIAGTKVFWKLMTYAIMIFILAIVMLTYSFVKFFAPAGTAASIGVGGADSNAPEATVAKGIILSTSLTSKIPSPGGLTVSGLKFNLGFSFVPDINKKISFPSGVLYAAVTTTSGGFTRSLFDASVQGATSTSFNQSQSLFPIDKDPVADTPIAQKNFDMTIKINNSDLFSKLITKDNPFCMNFAYLSTDPTSNDLSTTTPVQVSKVCVDGNGQLIGGDFICPVQPVNPQTPLACTYGSFEPCLGGVCTHKIIKAMDIGVPAGTPIVAPVSGTISSIITMGYCGLGKSVPYGGQASLLGDGLGGDNREYTFIHLSENIPVSNGQKVNKGDLIGYVWGGAHPDQVNPKWTDSCWTGAHIHTQVLGDSSNVAVSTQHANSAWPEDIYNNLLKCVIPIKVTVACQVNISKRDEAN